jgi:hypothetical protein
VKSLKFKIVVLLLFGFTLVGIVHADNRFVFYPGIMYFDYEETGDDGSFLNGETGPVPGITVALEHRFNPEVTGIVFGGIYTGTVDYDGQTQAGSPFQTDTQADFFTLGVAAQFPIKYFDNEISLIVDYTYMRWERDIQSRGLVSGLYEVYQWQELFIGAQFFFVEELKGRWSLFGGVFQTRNSEIEIDLVSDGYGKPRLSLGSDTGFELGAQWMEVNNKSKYGFRVSYKNWKFGRSANEISSGNGGSITIYEPKSETANIFFELIAVSPF